MQFILLEPFALYHTAVTEEWRKEVVEKQEVVRQIAKDYNTIFIPLQSVFDEATKRAPGDFWLADGVHPTLPGHHLIAKAWLAATQGIF